MAVPAKLEKLFADAAEKLWEAPPLFSIPIVLAFIGLGMIRIGIRQVSKKSKPLGIALISLGVILFAGAIGVVGFAVAKFGWPKLAKP